MIQLKHRPWEDKILGLGAVKPQTEEELLRQVTPLVDGNIATRAYRETVGMTTATATGNSLERQEAQGQELIVKRAIAWLETGGFITKSNGRYATTDDGVAFLADPPYRRPFGSEPEDGMTATKVKTKKADTVWVAAECKFCGTTVDPNANGTWTMVEGWIQKRKAVPGGPKVGGSNKLAHRSEPLAYACSTCLK